ncbi:hypothetical protein P692DRAFT_20821084 [Suillus brevipes Sb2]|nr:hypothetical protein P692DRAFT_20821084 [Suillus brevipes Sb2]
MSVLGTSHVNMIKFDAKPERSLYYSSIDKGRQAKRSCWYCSTSDNTQFQYFKKGAVMSCRTYRTSLSNDLLSLGFGNCDREMGTANTKTITKLLVGSCNPYYKLSTATNWRLRAATAVALFSLHAVVLGTFNLLGTFVASWRVVNETEFGGSEWLGN